ncbi:MAG: DsrE family protein [Sphingorhabdus sp.]
MRQILIALAATTMLTTPVFAQLHPRAVPGFGDYSEIKDPFEAPDPSVHYKIIFDVAQAARTPGAVHQGLERVARMINLLSRHGVTRRPGDIVVTLHGPAARTALTETAFAARFNGEANPNAELIRQLTVAGASVRLCGQSMVALGFAREELNPDIRIDVAAITTIGTLQMRGYALIPD